MNYVVFKTANRKEYRIYVDGQDYEGVLIYKGHKLSIELDSLSQLIDYRIERTTNRISVLNYEKVKDRVDIFDKNQWLIGTSDNFAQLLIQSWESLLKTLEIKSGKFRKILITEVNI
jgi:hypothetical protein